MDRIQRYCKFLYFGCQVIRSLCQLKAQYLQLCLLFDRSTLAFYMGAYIIAGNGNEYDKSCQPKEQEDLKYFVFFDHGVNYRSKINLTTKAEQLMPSRPMLTMYSMPTKLGKRIWSELNLIPNAPPASRMTV